ncbi:hypothetical protein NPIL_243301 [Nephila pilipes]|uniref:Uncharacterized protein n=1 Tax=Nephila pilipes TaxID=299642 RepID=A0A8X6PZQ6_NEPPI|nr:hypothetical protein NPIL_243301 [Nephila pilipes]
MGLNEADGDCESLCDIRCWRNGDRAEVIVSCCPAKTNDSNSSRQETRDFIILVEQGYEPCVHSCINILGNIVRVTKMKNVMTPRTVEKLNIEDDKDYVGNGHVLTYSKITLWKP